MSVVDPRIPMSHLQGESFGVILVFIELGSRRIRRMEDMKSIVVRALNHRVQPDPHDQKACVFPRTCHLSAGHREYGVVRPPEHVLRVGQGRGGRNTHFINLDRVLLCSSGDQRDKSKRNSSAGGFRALQLVSSATNSV